ncbi:glycosyl transferase 2 family protein [Lyngbya aestuarii BL J]|uniref:Glycosyl transferase 2 family protein n=1 Tax=Lyngbya aestuarii BL J TaxID=1348334 RepID=U7QPR7_9CYAN|nr:glycosyltransferase [Lyngbya aestuarii]ERT09954.1 glycosyl transferase 2 family protein [Lyngbya aestuarii BL J]
MNLDQTEIHLSVIIVCEKDQWEFLFDTIATVEDCLDIVDEVLIATSHFLSYDDEEFLSYFSGKGYIICQFDDNLSRANVLNLSIKKALGKYIFPLLAKNKINSNYLSDAVDILENKPNIGVIYGDIELFGENNKIQVLPDFSEVQLLRQNFINLSSLFRKQVWEDCGGFDVNIQTQTEFEWKFWLSAVENNWDFFHFPKVLLYQRIILDQGVPKNQNKQEIQKHPLVSVCIPTFNGDRFIAEAISSILSQTYPTLEIIVADDGSTDQTVAIIKTFQDKTSIDISLFSHQPLGLAQNCNFALSKAQGKYIKFLFQDDLLSPNCITELVKIAEKDNEIGLVFSPREICFVDEVAETDSDLISIYQEFQNIHQAWSSLKPIQRGEELLKDPHLFKHPINKIGEPSTVLIRREFFEKIGGFDPKLNQLVDLDLWLRIMGNYKVGFVNQVLSYFRLHTHQKTYQNISENLSTDLKFYQKVYSHPVYHFLPSSVRDRALCIYTINLNHFYLYFSDYSSGTFLENLRQLRREVAEYWLKQLLPEEFQTKPSSYFKIVYRILLRNKSLRAEPLTESEQIFVQSLINTITNSSANYQRTGVILALMLYPNSTQFSLTSDLISIPKGLYENLIDWIKIGDFNLVLKQ